MNLKKYNLDYYFLMCFKQIYIVGIVIIGLSGCVASLYVPTEIDAKVFNTTLDTLKTGRVLYINKCGGCHNLYLPAKYTKQEWHQIMDKMQKPAKIDNSQKELITKYIDTKAKNE
jgi:hypothetical protein